MYTDSLTQVYNRRYYDEKIFCHNARYELSKHVVFIVMDLNSFKRINDNYGHSVGDWVLFQTGQAMMECVRSQDSVIRLGGDEFLIVLNNCMPDTAERIITNIQSQLQKKVEYDSSKNKYAVGDFGIAYTDQFEPTEECISKLMEQADKAMYENKKYNANE
jgi:diguanylate cyclase (GGDEF)-like protein